MSAKNVKAMVLAAGVGSRLDPLTSQRPKPMVPIANKPVMEHIFNLLKEHGITNVVSNLHYMPEQIKEYFADGSAFGMNLEFRYEPELSGDAGGVRACRDFFAKDTFVVLMGDLLTDADLGRIIAEHKAKKALATIGIKEVDDVSQYGVVLTDAKGFITGFQEKPQPEEALSRFASTGIYIFEPEIFDHMPASGSYGFGKQLFPKLVQAGLPVLACDVQAYWNDVGTIAQYKQSNFDALEGHLRVSMASNKESWGVRGKDCQINASAKIEGRLALGDRCQIGPDVTIKGRVIIGDDCRIEKGACLEDTIIWSDTVVEANAQMKNCIVGSNCSVTSGNHTEIAAVKWPPHLVAR
ncbi:MAG: NDP-sugar synthase [Candidatus Obscuribacterales bacterium]|nr:NDP-sugar synthase [Candidatus Obscuribacterales bacterium]